MSSMDPRSHRPATHAFEALGELSFDDCLKSIIPATDRNGNPWSVQQFDIHMTNALALYNWLYNDGPSVRLAVSSVAGSGKSCVVYAMLEVISILCPSLLTSLTAFNTHIASDAMDDLNAFKKSHGLNAGILGGSNTVNAGGHALLTSAATGAGFSRVVLTSAGEDRYSRLSRIVLAGALGSPLFNLGGIQSLIVAKTSLNVKTTSHAFVEISMGLEKLCTILMNEGFVPSSQSIIIDVGNIKPVDGPDLDMDIMRAIEIVRRVGVNQGWAENPIQQYGRAAMHMACRVLGLAMHSAFVKGTLKPFCDGESMVRAVCPSKNHRGWWEDADSINRLVKTNDVEKVIKAQFAVLAGAGCIFPPPSKDKGSKGVSAVSFETTAKVIVKEFQGHTIMSFENGGHLKKIGGKAIGSQFGNNGDAVVNGERIKTWRHYDTSKGVTIVKPDCVEKVVALLTEKFGDEFHNLLEGGAQNVSKATSAQGSGACFLSMADQIYLPHALDLQLPEHERADFMFIDEVQDLSVLKASLVWRLAKDDAHKVIVGDSAQAIYLFAGASSTSLDDIANSINATFLPNTVCWRGTEMVAASVRVASADALEQVRSKWGSVDAPAYHLHQSPVGIGLDWAQGPLPLSIHTDSVAAAVGHAKALLGEDTTFGLLCRLKAPLAANMLQLLKAGIPISTPSGKDGIVNQAFSSLASRSRTNDGIVSAKTQLGLGWHQMEGFYSARTLGIGIDRLRSICIGKYTALHGGNAKAISTDPNFEEAMGNLDLLQAFVDLFYERGNGCNHSNFSATLKKWVEDTLFTAKGKAVHISTIHRYKGDEADVMFIIDSIKDDDKTIECFMAPRSMEASAESAINEANMVYVAYSRAQKWNIIVRSDVDENNLKERMKLAYDGEFNALVNGEFEIDSGSNDCPDCGLELCVCREESTVRYILEYEDGESVNMDEADALMWLGAKTHEQLLDACLEVVWREEDGEASIVWRSRDEVV